MTYKPFNEDSVIEKYHVPIYLKAKIIKVDSTEHTVYLQNIKTKDTFSISLYNQYHNDIHHKRLYYYPNKNKIYNFKYIFYPKNKEGYYIIPSLEGMQSGVTKKIHHNKFKKFKFKFRTKKNKMDEQP